MRVQLLYDRTTIQGEGAYAGARCTFVRLYGCNLHCAWCDVPETWDTRGRNGTVYQASENSQPMAPYDVAQHVLDLDVDLCIVSGGEPLIQRTEVTELARILHGHGVAVHIETNGTVSPGDDLAQWVEHWAISPKLPSARAGNDTIRLPVLAGFARMGWPRVAFKVVVMNRRDIDQARDLYEEVGVPRRARWVMPEGITPSAITHALADITEYALLRGLNVTGRQHVMLWGNERGR